MCTNMQKINGSTWLLNHHINITFQAIQCRLQPFQIGCDLVQWVTTDIATPGSNFKFQIWFKSGGFSFSKLNIRAKIWCKYKPIPPKHIWEKFYDYLERIWVRSGWDALQLSWWYLNATNYLLMYWRYMVGIRNMPRWFLESVR